MEGIETLALFEEKISLSPRDLANQKINIHGAIAAKIAEKLEGKCSLHGWVVPHSSKVLSRSVGYMEKGRFTGDIVFHVQAQATVLNPPSGSHLVAQVIGNNMMGMYVSYKVRMRETNKKTKKTSTTDVDAIKIILPRDLHIGDEAFSKMEIGDSVRVEIKKSRFQVNDKFILSVGVFEGKSGTEYAPRNVGEQANVVVEEAGPSLEAQERTRAFEATEAAKELANRQLAEEQRVRFENEMPPLIDETGAEVKAAPPATGYRASTLLNDAGLPYASGEPIYFNASKLEPYREFDNRFPAKFTLGGKEWPTVEHYYQAMKFPTLPEHQESIRKLSTASEAAKAGKLKDPAKPIRVDWKDQRERIMREALNAKFEQNPPLKQLLLNTYPKPIIFADSNDSFWGYGRTKMGQNKLGTMLMEIRNANTGVEAFNA